MSIATRIQRQEVIESLELAFAQSKDPNWDGDNATEVSAETFEAAKELLWALPGELPSPTIQPEPDGQICLEWYREPSKILSVSLAPTRQLHWAARWEDERASGSLSFAQDFPSELTNWVKRIFG